jgi:short subunit dehydrogenase-like uncharacterized protein
MTETSPPALSSRPLDVVVFGATGDTGSAACRLLYHHSDRVNIQKWAPACRNIKKLQEKVLEPLLKATNGGPRWACSPIQADSNDLRSLVTMCNQTRVVLACAGPYAKYGEKVIAACILSGCHYVDVTGEVDWVNAMKKRYNKAATTRGVSIVSFCGYDSVPMDLSAWLIADALSTGENKGDHATLVETFVSSSQKGGGGIPTGTINTVLTMVNKMRYKYSCGLLGTAPLKHVKVAAGSIYNELEVGNNHEDDVILTKRVKSLVKRDLNFNSTKLYKSALPKKLVWSSPHFMASINTPIVHSTAENVGFQPFKYHERAMSGGRKSWEKAHGSITAYVPVIMNFLMMCVAAPFVLTPFFENLVWWYVNRTNSKGGKDGDEHNVIQKLMNHGESTGYVGVRGFGESVSGKRVSTNMESDYDAGIGFTMLSALSIAGELNNSKGRALVPNTNGFQTPVCAIGGHLMKNILNEAGINVTVQVESSKL